MAEMSVIWLRVAAGLYSLGLLHAILTLVRRREHLFRVALGAFALGSVFHFVSIIEEGIVNQRCPITNFYETLSMCAFLIVALYLLVHWRYKVASLSVFIFPLVFVMVLVATLGNPVSAWSSPVVRSAWLTVHIVLVLLGYAALAFTAVASVLYLFQERELKNKKPRQFYYRLPALGTLDDLISKTMAVGFVLITLAVIAGATWGFIELKTAWIGQRGGERFLAERQTFAHLHGRRLVAHAGDEQLHGFSSNAPSRACAAQVMAEKPTSATVIMAAFRPRHPAATRRQTRAR